MPDDNAPPVIEVPKPSPYDLNASNDAMLEAGFDVERRPNGNLRFSTNDPEGKVTTSMDITLDLALLLRDWLNSHYPVG